MSFEPVKISTADVVDEERETLFWIDEDEYTIAKKIPPNITLKYLRDCAHEGQEVAIGRAMEVVLGEEAMAALAESDSVTEEGFAAIMKIVEDKLMSQMDKGLGKSRTGRRR